MPNLPILSAICTLEFISNVSFGKLILVSGMGGIVHNVGACAVVGIGGLGNEAKRNVKPDQLRPNKVTSRNRVYLN